MSPATPDRPTRRAIAWSWLSRNRWALLWSLLGLALIWRTGVRDRGVILDHLEFGRRVLAGLDLYAPYLEEKPLHAPYPPSFGLLTAPFSVLPDRLARFAWGALQVFALWIIARRLRDLALEHFPHVLPRLHLAFVGVAVLGGRYILRDTHGGGGNLINLALVLSSIHTARFHKPVRAGLLLGFSLATKPVAVLFVPYLWITGQRKAAKVALLASLGFLLLALLLLRQGAAPFLTWFDGSLRYGSMTDLFAEPARGFPPFTWMNQCLRCGVTRYFGTVPAEFAAQVPGFAQGLGWSGTATTWLTRALSFGMVALSLLLARRGHLASQDGSRPTGGIAGLAAVFAVSLLLSPISWKAHHVALIPAFFLLMAAALRGHKAAWVLGGLYVVVCGLGEELVGKGFKQVQQAHYFTTFGTIALLGMCLWQTAPQKLPSGPRRA